MTRRKFLKTSGLSLPVLSVYSLHCSAPVRSVPNIVYILADDMGYGDVGCLNPECKIPTPNINRLSAEGVRFTDAHSGSAVCTPTRYGILTGRYAWRSRLQSGVLWGYSRALIDTQRMTVASFLKRHGYFTGSIGKWHLGWNWALKKNVNLGDRKEVKFKEIDFSAPITNGPSSVGFDYSFNIPGSLDMVPYVYVENDRVVEPPTATVEGRKNYQFYRGGPAAPGFKHENVLPELTQKAVQFIERQTAAKPFFLYFPLNAPHTPILPTKEFQGVSGLGPYGDFVVQCDWTVGQILQTLQRKGFAENTLVIFTSDNGCSPMANFKHLSQLGHFPGYHFRGYKADIYEGGHRIPFIARWPGKIKPNSQCEDPICLTDLFATTADILGEKLPDNAGEDSVSILPDLFGTAHKPVREAIVHHSINGSFSVRQGKWKLELCPGSGGWSDPRPQKAVQLGLPMNQLYDLTRDISEQKNLQNMYPDVVFRLTGLLQQYVANGRSTPGEAQQNDVEVNIWKIQKLREEKQDVSQIRHKAVGKPVKLENKATIRYSAAGVSVLTDGVRATSFYDDGHWAGIEEDDLQVLIDLQKSYDIRQVGIGFLEDQEAWIFLPQKIELFSSQDGVRYDSLAEKELGIPAQHSGKKIKNVELNVTKTSVRFIRVVAKNIKTCPEWHPGNGGPAWIFADEIWLK